MESHGRAGEVDLDLNNEAGIRYSDDILNSSCVTVTTLRKL